MLHKSLTLKLFKKVSLLLFGFFLLTTNSVYAHGDLSIRIKAKTEEILKSPYNAALYFERGFLYQQHEEYTKALDDYEKSETLGNNDKLLYYRKANVYLNMDQPEKALTTLNIFLDTESKDVKAKKLEAQILFQLHHYSKALLAYNYVINTMTDLRPQDIIEFSEIILAENNTNYKSALEAIELGLNKIGNNTLSLHLKKLEYLELLGNEALIIDQYNYFILEYDRKEFWYYKKANYLFEIHKITQAKITLHQAKIAVEILDDRFKNTPNIKNLIKKIISLEKAINSDKS